MALDQDTAHAMQRTEQADGSTGAKWPRTPHMQRNGPSDHTGEQEPSDPGHCTRNTTHRASTPRNRSPVAQDTAHAMQRTKHTHRWTGAKWLRTPHTQCNAPSEHTVEQKPSGPGHCTSNTRHRASTPANRSQVA